MAKRGQHYSSREHEAHKASHGPNSGAHKGYLIKANPFSGEHHVSKNGSHIASYKSYEEAKKGIDEL